MEKEKLPIEKQEQAQKVIELLAWFFVLQFAKYILQHFKNTLTTCETERGSEHESLC